MNCKKCGNIITNQDQVCPSCGEPNELYVGSVEQAPTPIQEVPVVPTVPAEPVEPIQPVAPAVPVEPVQPIAPAEPVQPVQLNAPVTPKVPVVPVQPEPVVQPTQTPIQPEPIQPVEPQPVTPIEPVNPVVQEESSIPMQTAANPFNQAPQSNIVQDQPVPTVSQTKPKKNGLFVVTIIVLSLVIVGVGAFIAYKLLNPTTDNNEVKEDTTENSEVVQKTETMMLGGLTFTIPEGLTKKISNGTISLVDSKNGYVITLNGITDEMKLSDVINLMSSFESKYKENIAAQNGTYIGTSDYVLTGRAYYGVSYYVDSIYSDKFFTELDLNNYLLFGDIVYKTSSKDIAYKSLNDFIKSAQNTKNTAFTKTVEKDKIVTGEVTVANKIQ